MPATKKINVPTLNILAHDLFEIGKTLFVRNDDQKKGCEKQLLELAETAAEAKAAYDSGELSPDEKKEVARILDKLGIAKNYMSKALQAFTGVEDAKERADKALAKKRKEKEEMIAKRAGELKVRTENRKKKDAEEAAAKAKAA